MKHFIQLQLRFLLLYVLDLHNLLIAKFSFLNISLILCCILLSSLNLSSQVRLIGSTEVDRTGVIKEFDGSIYYTTYNLNDLSSLVKLDQNGNEIWTCPLTTDFYAIDFTKINNQIIIVGRTDVVWGSLTNSVIVSIDDLGNTFAQNQAKEFPQNQRDAFFRVAKHPANPAQLIVQGSRIDGNDNVILFVFDTDLNLIASNNYSSADDQFWNGLKENQLEISLMGNLGGTTRGCVVNYNPDLSVRNAFQYNNIGYIRDYSDRTISSKVIVGNTSNNIGFIAEIDNFGNQNWAITINESISIDRLHYDGSNATPSGVQYRYYLEGRTTAGGFLQRILVNVPTQNPSSRQGDIFDEHERENQALANTSISILWTRDMSIEGVNTIGNRTLLYNNSIYALNLFQNLNNGFGDDDFSFSITDINYNSCITANQSMTQSDLSLTPIDFTVTNPAYAPPTATNQTFLSSIDFDQMEVCFPNECIRDTLNISTGYNSIDDAVYSTMTQDGFWIMQEACQDNGPVNLGSPAWNINKHPAWAQPGYKSTYISAFPDPGSNLANINTGDPYTFRRCFCSTQNNAQVEFNINVHVDNQMKFYLYDSDAGTRTLLDEVTNSSSNNNFKGDPEHLVINPIILGAAGQYCLEAELRNDHNGTPMGLNISGWLAGNGLITDACCSRQSYITGYKYRDQDCDGIVSLGDPIVADWVIQLLDSEGSVIDKDTTDSNGYYVFAVEEGDYYLYEELKTDWQYATHLNGFTDLIHVNANEVVQEDFGNIYEGPLETEPVNSTCVEAGSILSFNWQGKSCDCTMTLFSRDCTLDSEYEAIIDLENTGSFEYQLPDDFIGDLEFLLQDCDGNEVEFDGCVSVNDFNLSISTVQSDCGEYNFIYNINNIDETDISLVTWNFSVIGSSNQQNPTFTFTEAGSYTIHLEIETTDGCVLNTSTVLDVAHGSGDPNCTFCEPEVMSQIDQGDLYIYDECFGMIIKSPSGNCFRVKVSDEGLLYAQGIECP